MSNYTFKIFYESPHTTPTYKKKTLWAGLAAWKKKLAWARAETGQTQEGPTGPGHGREP